MGEPIFAVVARSVEQLRHMAIVHSWDPCTGPDTVPMPCTATHPEPTFYASAWFVDDIGPVKDLGINGATMIDMRLDNAQQMFNEAAWLAASWDEKLKQKDY